MRNAIPTLALPSRMEGGANRGANVLRQRGAALVLVEVTAEQNDEFVSECHAVPHPDPAAFSGAGRRMVPAAVDRSESIDRYGQLTSGFQSA